MLKLCALCDLPFKRIDDVVAIYTVVAICTVATVVALGSVKIKQLQCGSY